MGKLVFTCIVYILLAACDGGTTPLPYLVEQRFEVQDECITDFSVDEEGECLVIRDGLASADCQRVEEDCVEHFYIRKRRGRSAFLHLNAPYPCYPDWLINRYSDPDSEWYLDETYRVVSIELSSLVIDETVHMIEFLSDQSYQSSETCLYRLEAEIEDLVHGEYTLKLWGPDQALILETEFQE